MQCHITYGSDIASDLKNLLEADDLAVVLSSKHRPRCIIGFISQCLQSLNLEGTKLTQLVIFLNEDVLFYEVERLHRGYILHLIISALILFHFGVLEDQCKQRP